MSVSTAARPAPASRPAPVTRAAPAARPAPAPAAPRRGHVDPPARPRLALVPAPTLIARRVPRPPRMPFALLLCALLGGGLLSLLMLHMALAQGAFALHDLEGRAARLDAQAAGLQQQLAEETAPQRLARRATALGMVPSDNPAFVRAADEQVLGVPAPGRVSALAGSGAPTRTLGAPPPLLVPPSSPLVAAADRSAGTRLQVPSVATAATGENGAAAATPPGPAR